MSRSARFVIQADGSVLVHCCGGRRHGPDRERSFALAERARLLDTDWAPRSLVPQDQFKEDQGHREGAVFVPGVQRLPSSP
jgi:hypothetical protein